MGSALKTPRTSLPRHPFGDGSSVIFPILLFSLALYGGATHHLAELPDVRIGSKADIVRHGGNVRFVPKADILPAVLSVGLIVRPDAHDVVGEMGVRVNSSLTPLIRLS
jgi:hypothetical protein